MRETAVIILAAGQGKRMKSRTPKILHPLGGRPMIQYALDLARDQCPAGIYLVVGKDRERIQASIQDTKITLVEQVEPLGTGHAVQQVMPALEGFEGDVLILCGDMPLLTSGIIGKLVMYHRDSGASITMLTAHFTWPNDFGRVIRRSDGPVDRIVEARDASPEELAGTEVNLATYCVKADTLRRYLPRIGLPNVQRELYFTDLVLLAVQDSQVVEALAIPDPTLALGINSRSDLARAQRVLQDRILTRLLDEGITIIDPPSVHIDHDVVIGMDTVIKPYTILEGRTEIGEDCVIGPGCRIHNSKIGNRVTIQDSVLQDARVEDDVRIGPFAYLRPGADIGSRVKVGDFVEIKKSRIESGSKVPHLSYIGDATVGSNVNIGAGVITCNYDGANKHPTNIEDDVQIGANTNLVAPVRVGKGSKTGAGSVVTKDIPPHHLAVGMPARVIKTLPSGEEK